MGALSRTVWQIRREDAGYPDRLKHLTDAPAVLYGRGDPRALDAPCVTIVGSRRSTAYGRRVAEELAQAAVRSGWTVLSGLALGVDGAAHRGTVMAGGRTVAVLAGGPDRAHPAAHRPLLEQLLERGAVLSEYEPGVTPRKHHFPRRNRILAALAWRVVVVEAASRSGALITASIAADLGRDVWAVPASIFSPTARGTLALLEDGAVPVVSVEAWEASLAAEGMAAAEASGRSVEGGGPRGQLSLGPQQDALQARIWQVLGNEELTLEALALRVERPLGELLSALTHLELSGWLTRRPGPAFRRRAA
ncbi:MAG: DNA-processing protein DprA [Longimicrobiales bacterium]|nr:DNA-processing protein DprA [Longimicrobiales bacterium]